MLTVPVGVYSSPNNKILVVGNGKFEYHDLPVPPFKIVECSETDAGAEFTNLIGGGTSYIRREEYPYLPTIRRTSTYGERVEQEIDYVLEVVKEFPDVFEKFTCDGYIPYPLIYDIETSSSNGHFPSADKDQIISIQVKFIDTDAIILVDDSVSLDGEVRILTEFLNLVKISPTGKTPDIMVGFFNNKFDTPYIVKRISVLRRHYKELGILFDSLNRAPLKGDEHLPLFYPNWIMYGKDKKEMIDIVPGLLTLDLYIHAKVDLELTALPNRKLKTVSRAYGFNAFDLEDEEKKSMQDLLRTDREKFMKYSTSDVLATEYLYNIYIQRLIAASNLLRCPLSMVHRMSSGQKSYLALYRDCRKHNYHALDRNDKRYEYLYDRAPKYQGALVACYKRGYFPRTIYLDAKCMHRETELLTEEGYKSIKDIPVGTMIYANNRWQKIHHKQKTIRKEAVRITTEHGNCIIVSVEHRFPVYKQHRKVGYNSKDYIIDVPAGNLEVKDILMECYKYPLSSDQNHVNIMSNENAELLGIFDAEGCHNESVRSRIRYDRNNTIQHGIRYTLISFTIHINELLLRERIVKLMKDFTGDDPSLTFPKNKRSVVIQYSSHSTYDKIIDLQSKRDKILNHVDNCKSYLAGLVTGDGHYNKIRKTLTLTQSTVNNNIIEFAHKCLIRCGIPHKLTGDMKAECQSGMFKKRMIEIPTIWLKPFMEIVTLIEPKIKLENTWVSKKPQNDIKDGYRLARIRSIEKYIPEDEEEFYDIMVDDQSYPYFFANNILTHNSLYPNIMHDFMVSYDSYKLEETIEYPEWEKLRLSLPKDAMIQPPINKSATDNYPSIVSYGPPDERIIMIPDDNYELTLKFKFNLITEGFMRRLINHYNGERDRYKKLMVKYENEYKTSGNDEDRIKAMMYNSFQGEAKIINNTFYGVQANKYYEHADLPAAIFITAIGRWIMTEMVRMFGKKAIIEIDTDGLLLDRDYFNMEIDDINRKLRQRMNDFFGIPVDKMNFLLEFEGAGSVYMYKRKNYILRKDSSPNKLITKGSSFRGYDKAKIVTRATAIMAEAVMNQVSPTTYSDACEKARDIRPLLITDKDMFKFTKTLKKRPEDYKGFKNNVEMYINAVDHTLPKKELFLEKKKRAFTCIELVMGRDNNAAVQRMKQNLRDCKNDDQLKQFATVLQSKGAKGKAKGSNYLLDLIMKLKYRGREVEVDDVIEYYYSLTADKYMLEEDLKSDSDIDVSRYLADIDSIIERFSYADPRKKALSLMDLMEEDDEIEEGFEDVESEDDDE